MAVENLAKTLMFRDYHILKLLSLQLIKQKSERQKQFRMMRIYSERQKKENFIC